MRHNTYSSNYILLYKDCISKKEFLKRYKNNYNDDIFKNDFCLRYSPEEINLIFITKDRVKKHLLQNPYLYEFDEVYIYPRLINDYECPVEITPDLVDYKIESFRYIAGAGDFFIYYNEEIYEDEFLYLDELHPFEEDERWKLEMVL